MFGALIGIALGHAGGPPSTTACPGGGLTARYEGIYALGFAPARLWPRRRHLRQRPDRRLRLRDRDRGDERDVPDGFVVFAENASAILQVITFFVFGALIVATGFDHSVPPLIAFVPFALLVARPAAVVLSFVRTGLPRPQQLFMAWFGPKGVASMLFALFVLKSEVDDGRPYFRRRGDRDHRLDRHPRPHRHAGRPLAGPPCRP